MTLIHWSRRLEVGVAEIDGQHRHLIDTINRLHEHIVADQGRDVVGAILEQLERDTERHFATEERLMDKHDYPQSDTHKAEHRMMLDDIRRHSDSFVLGRSDSKVVLGCLEHWFMHHIGESDRRLGAALAGLGAA